MSLSTADTHSAWPRFEAIFGQFSVTKPLSHCIGKLVVLFLGGKNNHAAILTMSDKNSWYFYVGAPTSPPMVSFLECITNC